MKVKHHMPFVPPCPYCEKVQPSKFAAKRHKEVCRASPLNQGSNRYVIR